MNAPRLRSIASAVCALALGMTLVACGGPSSYSQELLTEASGIKVTCENSKGDTALSEGAIVVEENGIVVISPDLTKGSIHVKITSEDGKTTVYDDDADGRILFTVAAEPGTYDVETTSNGATGSMTVFGTNQQEFIEQDEALIDALETQGVDAEALLSETEAAQTDSEN